MAYTHRVDARGIAQARRKFLEFFPGGFRDELYLDWERDYKWKAHRAWEQELGRASFRARLDSGDHEAIAASAVRIESRTNLLFSFEKMALRDAVAAPAGAKLFATGLYDWLYGSGSERARFERWCAVVAELPRRQTRVATWPVVTVFGFIARPKVHMFLKPTVTRVAAEQIGCQFDYRSKPQWETYASLLGFAGAVRTALAGMKPRDMIDVQSFIWVQGSSEYD